MPGFTWHIVSYTVVVFFIILITYRTYAISKLPLHLRWELAPTPHEKVKSQYGGSYLEEYEWWHKPRRKSQVAPLVYMAKEIFFLRSVWDTNRALWPFSFSFHTGIYLILGMLILQLINTLFLLLEIHAQILDISLGVASFFALIGYLLGSLGTIGLFLKRTIDVDFKPFNTFSKYFNLLFLGAMFISGCYARLSIADFTFELGAFMKDLVTFNGGMVVTFPMSLHLGISFLFLLYLPLSDMVHFVAKYFTYHQVRWDDLPQDEKMEKAISLLLAQPVSWSASHIGANGSKSWIEVASTDKNNDKEA